MFEAHAVAERFKIAADLVAASDFASTNRKRKPRLDIHVLHFQDVEGEGRHSLRTKVRPGPDLSLLKVVLRLFRLGERLFANHVSAMLESCL